MKKLLLLLAFTPVLAYGQGVFIPTKTVLGTVNGVTRPIANATLTLCGPNSPGIPCSPALASTLFKDSGLTVPLANPTTTDAFGNYPQMAVAGGIYTLTESAPGFAGFSQQVTVSCAPGGACSVTSLVATSATITGALTAGGGTAGSPTGTLAVGGGKPWYDITAPPWNAKCDGATDDTTAINNAMAAANTAGGGMVFVPVTSTGCLVTGQLNCDGCNSVALVGYTGSIIGAPNNLGAARPKITLSSSTSPLVSLRSTFGFKIEGIFLNYTNAAFTGLVVTYEHTVSGGDSQGGKILDSVIAGTSTATSATALVALDKVDNFEIDHALFQFAINAIRGEASGGSYSNTVVIRNSLFSVSTPSGNITGAMILSPGSSWNIGPNDDFEIGTTAVNVIDCTTICGNAVTFESNFVGDAPAGWTGTVFKSLGTGGATGYIIKGNQINGGSSQLGTFLTGATASQAYFVTGNFIQFFSTGYTFTGNNQPQVSIFGNEYGNITTFMPQRPGVGSLICDNTNTCTFYGPYLVDNNIGSFKPAAPNAVPLGSSSNGWSNLFSYTLTNPATNELYFSATAPTILAAGCGGSAASIPNNNGTAAFEVNVGTTPGSACTITMPTASHGWACSAVDVTTNSTSVFYQKQSPAASQTTTQIVITNFSDVAAATAFTGSDVIRVMCNGY